MYTISKPKIKTEDTVIAILLTISLGHLFNDVMQSMLPAIYPILSENYGLTFLQIGIITATYQITGSVLQPLIGFFTDKRPLPYSLPFSSLFTMTGLLLLAHAHHYYILLIGASLVGFGSSIFHPEASRVTRFASGGRHGFAQAIFQVGGNTGAALGPLLAALFISQQNRIGYFSLIAFLGFLLLIGVSRWYATQLKITHNKTNKNQNQNFSKAQIASALFILLLLMLAKYIYLASMSNFYMFYAIDKYGIDTQTAQILLFLYLSGIAIGTIFGGRIGDRIGTRSVIWVSILGVLPFTLLMPHVSLSIMAILSIIIGAILASAFPAIVVFVQELLPGRVGTVAGLCFGLSFGIGAISAAALGHIADIYSIQTLFNICSFLPFLGLVAIFLPKLKTKHVKEQALQ